MSSEEEDKDRRIGALFLSVNMNKCKEVDECIHSLF